MGSAFDYAQLELNLAVAASRSSLIGALLRAALPLNRPSVFTFLRGLSSDELLCLAEFQGACVLETMDTAAPNAYRVLPEFFDPAISDRWQNADDRAHKTFVVLAWLDYTSGYTATQILADSVQSA